jgi:hypothetical protein
MKTKYTSLIIAGALLATTFAGTIKSRGTAGATQLSVPVGAHGIALNGANLATVSGVDALFFNPAGASNFDKSFEAVFTNMSYIADIEVNYVALVANAGKSGVFGFSVKSFDFGEIVRTSAENTEGTGETFSPDFMTVSATWSKALADRMRVGVNLKYVQERIMRTSASGMGVDMGVQYSFANLPVKIGVMLSNLGSKMQYAGSDLEQKLSPDESEDGTKNESFQIVSEGFEIPAELNMSINYEVIPNLSLMASFNNNSFSNNQLRLGGEYNTTMGTSSLWIGGAIAIESIDDEKPEDIDQSDWDEYGGSNFGTTFGAGINYPIGNMIVSLEVAQRSVVDYFDNNLVYSIKIAF